MRLYHCSQVSQKLCFRNRRERHNHCWMVQPQQMICCQQQEGADLIQSVRKPPNPNLASPQHRALHQELLLCHRRGLLPRRQPELLRVLELRQREQHKQRDLALHPPTDLEAKLHQMQQRLQRYELEEKKRSESLQDVPEFVRVRGTLKHVEVLSS